MAPINNKESSRINNKQRVLIGFNNQLSDEQKQFFWNYHQSNAVDEHQTILLDDLYITNHPVSTKKISHDYLKSYYIKNDYDPVEQLIYMTSLNNRQSSIVLQKGATVTKSSDENWYLKLNNKNNHSFALSPDMFDSCLIDADNLCPFGFTLNLWLKFSFSKEQIVAARSRSNFSKMQQILFFTGSPDLATGLELVLYVTPPKLEQKNNEFFLQVNFKTSQSAKRQTCN